MITRERDLAAQITEVRMSRPAPSFLNNKVKDSGQGCRIALQGLGPRSLCRASALNYDVGRESQQKSDSLGLNVVKVLIIASKRKVAKQLAKQALAHGHVVTVLQSRGLRIRFRNPRYRRLKGNVLNEGSLAPAMAGQEAVVCWLSMWPSRERTTYFWEGTANVILARLNAGVSRLVCGTVCGGGE